MFGEELRDSIASDAPLWLGIATDVVGIGRCAARLCYVSNHSTKMSTGSNIPTLTAQSDHPVSYATDLDLNTAFKSLAAPQPGHTLTIDLQVRLWLKDVVLHDSSCACTAGCVPFVTDRIVFTA